MTEEQLMFFYWYEELSGSSIEELCEKLEITVDYFIQEFI
jgi:hypothetical protein